MMNYPYYPNYMQSYQQNFQQVPKWNELQQPQVQPQQDERLWVQGEESAKAYLVAPNSFVRLWDSQRNVFYEKKADATGKPTMSIYEYSLVSSEMPQNSLNSEKGTNILIDDFKALQGKLDALQSDYEALTNRLIKIEGELSNVRESNADVTSI